MAESLRDQLEANYDKIVSGEEPQKPAEPEATSEPEKADAPDKPGRTFGRERDDKGRLLPGPAKRDSATGQEKTPPAQDPNAQATQTVPAAEPHPERPSSWKKDYWDYWTKLDPAVAKYIRQREDEYAKGVSTYKNEYDRAKPFLDAYAPYQQEFERYGIDPAKQFAKYVEIHRTFAQGTPQQKLATFMQLASDYQVPVQELFVQGQDGRLYFNQQYQQQQQAASQQQQPQQDVKKLVQEALTEQTMQQQIEAMKADAKGYPHFEAIRETMAGLLQAGLAQDLKSAYEAALRMPAHSDLWDAMQKQQRNQEEKEKAEAQRKAVEAARRNNVSPKSATPAGQAKGPGKGLRAQLESAYDEVVGGRV